MRYSGRLFYFCAMSILLFDHPEIRPSLLPLAYTRPLGSLRVGIMTIAEKWQHDLGQEVFYLTEPYLGIKYPGHQQPDSLFINGALLPDDDLAAAVSQLQPGEAWHQDGMLLAAKGDTLASTQELLEQSFNLKSYAGEVSLIRHTWELFLVNGDQIRADFKRLTANRSSEKITDPYTVVYHPENVFLEPGVSIKAAIINAESGPVYLGKDAEVQEGTIIQGPFALGEMGQLRLGGKMRPNTTIGPGCKVGGEVGNVIFQSNSNKAHEGFLGNSVIGSWCNLGADTNNSNLKNNYSNVKVWDYSQEDNVDTGLQFCGTIMGDHSKCSINTMFNTGTIVGVCANLFGEGFPPKFVPSWSWGGINKFETYDFEKSCHAAERIMERRSQRLDQVDKDILKEVFNLTQRYRQQIQ